MWIWRPVRLSSTHYKRLLKIPQYVTNKIPQYITNKIPQYDTNKIPQYVTNKISQYVTNKIPQYVTNKIPQYVTNKVQVLHIFSQLYTDKSIKKNLLPISEKITSSKL